MLRTFLHNAGGRSCRRALRHGLFLAALVSGPLAAWAGQASGLLGTYYDQGGVSGAFFTGASVQRIDTTVNYNWGSAAPGPIAAADNFSVRWTGYVRIPSNGAYFFRTISDDGVRLWVNGTQVINNWTDHGSTTDTSASIPLSAGQVVPVTLEYYERGGSAVMQLQWQTPGAGSYVAIPADDGSQGLLHDDITPPTLVSATTGCGVANRVNVTFSEAVSAATAQVAGNYTISGGIAVSAATLLPDGQTVSLQTSALTVGSSYTVSVSNVRDVAGNTIAPASSQSFSYGGGALNSGLLATYYDQNNTSGAFFTGNAVTQVDATLNFNWGAAAPTAGIGADNFTVRWTGYVLATVTGNYQLQTTSDDGIRLWLGGAQLINDWTDHGTTTDTSAVVTLVAGQYYPITVEYYERGGSALATLSWQINGGGYSIIPSTNLFYCDTTAPTLSSTATMCGVNNRIVLSFSEAVETVSATTPANYALDHGAAVTAVALNSTGTAVTLSTSPLAAGTTYTLTVNNVGDRASPPNRIALNSQITATLASGSLTSGAGGTYYDQNNVSGAFFTGNSVFRADSTIDFSWGGGSPGTFANTDNFSVRWQGYVKAPTTGTYVFRTYTDDGVRFYLSGAALVNNWTDHGGTYDVGAGVSLLAGEYYPIQMDYYERGGGAEAHLQWLTPGAGAYAAVPAAQLYYCGPATVTLGGFNAVNDATQDPVTGRLKTKVAGTTFPVDIVALNVAKTGVETAFTGSVKIEVLNAADSSGPLDAWGCRSSWVPIAGYPAITVTFAAPDLGRKTVSLAESVPANANVWPDVRIRVTYPATGAAQTLGCSSDNFALRPDHLVAAASDADWATPGTARLLNNSVATGGTVHKAGLAATAVGSPHNYFTLTATATNAAGNAASNYSGTPAIAAASGCIVPAGCTLDTNASHTTSLTLGTWASAGGGSMRTDTAAYGDVGTLSLWLEDTGFAAVDAADSSTAERTVPQTAASIVGRFVPDHYQLASSAVTPACAGATAFSYLDQPFAVTYLLQAANPANGVAANYQGTVARATVLTQAENNDNGTDLSARLSLNLAPLPSWSAGQYLVNATGATLARAAAVDGPFDQLRLSVKVTDAAGAANTDPDGVALAALDENVALAGACGAACNAKRLAAGATSIVRYGRLSLSNAYGSELRSLSLPLRVQYFNGAGFVTHGADTACTAVTVPAITLSNYRTNLNAGETTPTVSGSLGLDAPPASAGRIVLSAPGAGNNGSVDVTVAVPAWLQWLGANPTARATFGIYKGSTLFRREVTF